MVDALRTTLDAISHVLDVYNVGRIEATSRRVRSDGRTSEWHVRTHTRDRSWVITDSNGVTETSIDDKERSRQIATDGTRHTQSSIAPIAVRLCFPLDLPIWGRMDDDWAIDHADSTNFGYTIALLHTREPGKSAHVEYSTEYGLATKFAQYQGKTLIAELALVDILRPGRRAFSDGSVMLATGSS